jgi:hypothetical protein
LQDDRENYEDSRPSKPNTKHNEIDILARARFSFAATQDIEESHSDNEELQDLIDSDRKAYVDDVLRDLAALRKIKDERSKE